MSKYELSLSPEYVADWTVTDGVRELFQNALDQQTEHPNNLMFMKYENNVLSIGNKTSVLEAQSLLLGHSTKRTNSSLIGQFGEGYKIGVLVLLRAGKVVTFYNYGKKEIWRPRLVKSRKYQGATILVFETFKKPFWDPVPDNNLNITIEGITPEEYKDIVDSNLHCQELQGEMIETPQGRILLDPIYEHKVYVNGLFIRNYEEYKCGYDFKPAYIKINRDRKLVDNFDLQWLASRMWAGCKHQKFLELVQANTGDVRWIASHSSTGSLNEQAYSEFSAMYGSNAIPVTDQFELEDVTKKYINAKPIIVPAPFKELINGSLHYGNNISKLERTELTPKERLFQWYTSIQDRLTDEEQESFDEIFDSLAE